VTHAAARRYATDVVGRRLLAAAYRENVEGARDKARWDGERLWLGGAARRVSRHAGDRLEVREPVAEPPDELLLALGIDRPALAEELIDAVRNLSIAYERRLTIDAELRATGARDLYELAAAQPTGDDQAVFYERLAIDGHNLHPCGRTRLGWTPAEALAYDQEAESIDVGFIAVREDLYRGDDVAGMLRQWYPSVPTAPPGYRTQPVHPWQRDVVIRHRYAALYSNGRLRRLPGSLPARPTTALRTVLLGPDAAGIRRYLKLSLDIQVTSTRRSISIASTRNGPALSETLSRVLADEPGTLLMAELAGSAVDTADGRSRDIAAIMRAGLGRLRPGEVAVPAAALPARSPITGKTVLAELVDRFTASHPGPDPALEFLATYARVLLPPVLRLATRYGVGLEAHLQNCLPVFHDGVPVGMGLRDLAGLRVHLPRFKATADPGFALWPGSVIGTDDEAVMLAKVAYTAFSAHLGELVIRLGDSHGLVETVAWQAIRHVVDQVLAGAADHAFFVAPTLPYKGLLRMRLDDRGGDIYVPVQNPLYGA
jgi:siderophore synthetase component